MLRWGLKWIKSDRVKKEKKILVSLKEIVKMKLKTEKGLCKKLLNWKINLAEHSSLVLFAQVTPFETTRLLLRV